MSDMGRPEDNPSPAIQRLAGSFSWILLILSAGLLFLFAWPEVRTLLDFVFGVAQPDWIREVTLFGYFASWCVAMQVDVSIQKYVYRANANRDRLFLKGFGIAVTLFAVALVMIWSRNSAIRLAIVLNMFFLTNVIAWLLTEKLVRPVIELSRKLYQGSSEEHSRLAQLDIVASYINGRWQWWRFLFMLLLICFMDIIS